MGSVSGASSTPGSFAGVHFSLVSASGSHVALISGLELVPVGSGLIACSGSLKIMFSYVPRFVSTISRACGSSESFSGLPGACALAIKFGCFPDSAFTFACTGSDSSCGPKSLCAALALPGTFTLVE